MFEELTFKRVILMVIFFPPAMLVHFAMELSESDSSFWIKVRDWLADTAVGEGW